MRWCNIAKFGFRSGSFIVVFPLSRIMFSGKTCLVSLFVAGLLGSASAVHAGEDFRSPESRRWWRGEWKDEFRDGPCKVKTESKHGEYKREIKCKEGVGAQWRGEWKTEFRDGPCLVKQEAKRDEFKEEVKCER